MRFILTFLLSASLARGGVIEDLAHGAQLIVRGKVEAKSIQRDTAGRIFTETKIAVKEVWKGNPKEPLLTIVSGDGILGERKISSVGEVSYQVGEDVLAFVIWNDRKEAVTLEMANGKFEINGDLAQNASSKMTITEMRQRVKVTLQ